MRLERLISILPKHPGDYKFAWIFAFALAVLSAPFIVVFKQDVPWLIAIPLSVGAFVILLHEFVSVFNSSDSSDLVVTIPPGFSGVTAYEKLLALEVHPKRKVPKEQLSLFPGFTETTPTNSVRLIMDKDTGNQIAVVSCSRFSALLVTYLLDNMDKATEKSLRAGLSRFGSLESGGRTDIQIFVEDKGVREAIKADFRGNLVTLVSKGGEKVIKDLLKALEAKVEEEKQNEEEKQKPLSLK